MMISSILILLVFMFPPPYVCHALLTFGSGLRHRHQSTISISNNEVLLFSSNSSGADYSVKEKRGLLKESLLSLIGSVPQNSPSSRSKTDEILRAIRDLENLCPTVDENVVEELAGTWKLIWTAQDSQSVRELNLGLVSSYINPLENQAYSNNPLSATDGVGRANPFLPRDIQDRLEQWGIVASDDDVSEDKGGGKSSDGASPVVSTQSIDLKRKRVRNVVSFKFMPFGNGMNFPLLPFKVPASSNENFLRGIITVDVKFWPPGTNDNVDLRRVDVKFEECTFVIKSKIFPVNIKIPLGPIGPRGWLRTEYIDDSIRITRGHKGSVFVLSR